ncbi:MAG: ABC transporter ATP-binding protein [Oscillospiraceae bacterium]
MSDKEKNVRPPKMMGGGPNARMMMSGKKAKNFKGSFSRLIGYIAPHKLSLFFVIIFAATSTIFAIVGPKILAMATDALVVGLQATMVGAGGIDFAYIAGILLFCLALYIISSLFMYSQGFIMAGVSSKVSYDLRNSLEKKINRLPLEYFHQNSTGDVLSRITNDVDTLSQGLNQSISQFITSIATFIGVLAMMFSINVGMTFIALLTLPVSAIGVALIVKKSQKHFKGQQSYLGEVNGHVEEMYGGHLIIKAFNRENKSVEEFDEANEKLYNATWKAQFLSGLMHPLMTLIGNAGYVLICIVGAAMTVNGTMTIGGIQAFIQYVRNLNQPVSQLANISNQIQMTVAAAERVFEFLDEPEEKTVEPKFTVLNEGEEPTENSIKIDGNIRFDHVHFGYDPEQIIINDFSADIKAGQKVAIVGPTGAGKTTLVKLLMRFYDINSGSIYIDDHNIDDFTREELRTEFGMVLQDTWLYSGTIMDNIRYGKLNATDEEVIQAAKAAQIHRFIRSLPDSYNMVLNEEATNVSQGQKQLLTIARAILANARVLILDEATSSVDTRTEIQIQKAMDNLMKGRTSFVIAHRLSTIRDADLILCMNNGDIVEQGTHDELMAKGGFYAKLYNSQFDKATA